MTRMDEKTIVDFNSVLYFVLEFMICTNLMTFPVIPRHFKEYPISPFCISPRGGGNDLRTHGGPRPRPQISTQKRSGQDKKPPKMISSPTRNIDPKSFVWILYTQKFSKLTHCNSPNGCLPGVTSRRPYQRRDLAGGGGYTLPISDECSLNKGL